MNLHIEENQYQNLTEIYIISKNAIEVVTKNGKLFRIYAKETIRGPHKFSASYDELVKSASNSENKTNNHISIWTRNHNMPWEQGGTIEGCIKSALHWLNERGNN